MDTQIRSHTNKKVFRLLTDEGLQCRHHQRQRGSLHHDKRTKVTKRICKCVYVFVCMQCVWTCVWYRWNQGTARGGVVPVVLPSLCFLLVRLFEDGVSHLLELSKLPWLLATEPQRSLLWNYKCTPSCLDFFSFLGVKRKTRILK